MILLFLPLLTAILNRVRGEGIIPRVLWYAIMVTLGSWYDARLILPWLLYFLGYAMMPWQAMFSAINGNSLSRKDHWSIQWMQDVSRKLAGNNNYRFGIVYGALRATLMIPGIVWLAIVTGSLLPLIGLIGMGMGGVYYLCGRFSRHELGNNAIAVLIAELVMGWWNGTYMLILMMA